MIAEVLNNLTREEHRRLMVAFESEISQYVELPKNHFVGVNTQTIKHLQPTEVAGAWSYGDIKGRD